MVKKIANIPSFSFQTEVCSKCGLPKLLSNMYRNKLTGEYWCMHCLGIEKKKRNAKCFKKKLEPDIKMKSKEEPETFRTWDEFCLDKLKEIGKASLTKWATAMDYKNSASISRTAHYLEEQGKVRVIHPKGGKTRKYYEAI